MSELPLYKNNSAPIHRLGIPSYNWWNEALLGVTILAGVGARYILVLKLLARELLRLLPCRNQLKKI